MSRLSAFAIDALLSVIYRLEEIEDPSELSTLEAEILETAKRYDKQRVPPEPKTKLGDLIQSRVHQDSIDHYRERGHNV